MRKINKTKKSLSVVLIAVLLTNTFLASRNSFAETIIGAKGGIFLPSEKKVTSGSTLLFTAGSSSDNFDVLLDFGYRKFEREMEINVGGLSRTIKADTPVTSIPFIFNIRYKPIKKPVIPFVGAGAGISFNIFDFDNLDKEVQKQGATWVAKNEFAIGAGLNISGGVKIPLSDTFHFVAEGRYSYEVQLLKDAKTTRTLNLGGFSALFGFEMLF